MKIRKIILISFTTTLLAACSSGDNVKEKNIALIDNYIEAVENLDYQSMEALLDENYLGLGPSYGDSIGKTEAVENWKFLAEHLYKGITYNRQRSVAVSVPDGENKGDWVSTWAELSIYYKDLPDTVTIWANTIYQLEGNKIIKSFTFYNEADALRQLGYQF
jgi:hypothetical protein